MIDFIDCVRREIQGAHHFRKRCLRYNKSASWDTSDKISVRTTLPAHLAPCIKREILYLLQGACRGWNLPLYRHSEVAEIHNTFEKPAPSSREPRNVWPQTPCSVYVHLRWSISLTSRSNSQSEGKRWVIRAPRFSAVATRSMEGKGGCSQSIQSRTDWSAARQNTASGSKEFERTLLQV